MSLLMDLDGTLVRLPIDWSAFYRFLQDRGIEMKFLRFIREYWGTDLFWQAHEFLKKLELEALSRVVVYESVGDLLENLSQRVKIAIITFQSRSVAEEVLRIMGLKHVVEEVVAREDCGSRLCQIRMALTRLGSSPEESLFIGDKVNDAISAVACGTRCAIVFRGLRSSQISDTDDVLEDLSSWGIPVFSTLREALEYAARLLR